MIKSARACADFITWRTQILLVLYLVSFPPHHFRYSSVVSDIKLNWMELKTRRLRVLRVILLDMWPCINLIGQNYLGWQTKKLAQRYQTTLSAGILLAEVVGWERDILITSMWQSLFAEHSKGAPGALVGLLLQARGQDKSSLSTKTCLHQERWSLRTECERFVQGCISFKPPPVQVECLHHLKEGKHHKHKVQRSGCKVQRSGHKVQRSGPASALVGTGCSNNNMQLKPPPPIMQIWPTQLDAAITATCVRTKLVGWMVGRPHLCSASQLLPFAGLD